MTHSKTAPCGKQGAAVSQSSVVADEDTANNSERQVLIDFSLSIESYRRQRALELAKLYEKSPASAIAGRYDLRDLRLLGLEVGRLAWGVGR